MGEHKGYILEEGEVEPGKYGILIYSSVEDWRNRNPVDTAWDEADAKRKIDEGEVLGKLQPGGQTTDSKRTISIDDHALEDLVALADNAGDVELRDFLLHAPRRMSFISEFLGVRKLDIPDALYKRLLKLIDEEATTTTLPATRDKYQKYKRYLEEYGKTY